MLLDLGRNDAGKVSKINTVKVTEEFKIEKERELIFYAKLR